MASKELEHTWGQARLPASTREPIHAIVPPRATLAVDRHIVAVGASVGVAVSVSVSVSVVGSCTTGDIEAILVASTVLAPCSAFRACAHAPCC